MKICCKYCGRYLMDVVGTTIIENLICPNSKCKAHLNIKVITPKSSIDEINYKFQTLSTMGKELKHAKSMITPPKNESQYKMQT